MSVLREGIDREKHGEAPPPVLQVVGSGRGGPTAVSGEWPEEEGHIMLLTNIISLRLRYKFIQPRNWYSFTLFLTLVSENLRGGRTLNLRGGLKSVSEGTNF